MHQLEAELARIERDGAGDIPHLIADAVNTLDEGTAFSVGRTMAVHSTIPLLSAARNAGQRSARFIPTVFWERFRFPIESYGDNSACEQRLPSFLLCSLVAHVQGRQSADLSILLQSIAREHAAYADVAKQIWGFAEVGYKETKSSALLQQELRAGRIHRRAASPASRLRSSRRSDPASRSSRSSASSTRCPGCRRTRCRAQRASTPEGAGHGCGHNLFGTGALAAAIAVKEWLAAGHDGTLRYYGTPAEEGGAGKVYMVRAGLFNDVDAVIAWHPGRRNEASAVDATSRTSPASSASTASRRTPRPRRTRGRSALDAVEAMDTWST